MKIHLTTLASEKGTFAVEVAFTNEAAEAFTPNSGLNWTLTDRSGNVINSRSAVSITPASTVTIVLSGLDLAVPNINDRYRLLTVEGTYNSTTLGNNLPFKVEIKFKISNLEKVT